MSRVSLLCVCVALVPAGCESGFLCERNNADIVFRCKTITQRTATGRVVKYMPIEVIKGHVGDEMLDSNGYLKYTRTLEEDEDVGEIYVFELRKITGRNRLMPNEAYPFGFNCEMSVELELGDGKGITE